MKKEGTTKQEGTNRQGATRKEETKGRGGVKDKWKIEQNFEAFGPRLALLMDESNLNNTEMAKIVGLSRSMITLYASGRRKPSLEILLRIAKFFNVSVDWLLGRTENKLLAVNKDQAPLGRTVKIPLLSETIQRENPIDALENVLSYIETPAEQVRGADYFYVRNGNDFLVRKQDNIENKEFAAVLLDGRIKVMSARKHDKLFILSSYKDKSDIQVIMPGIIGKPFRF